MSLHLVGSGDSEAAPAECDCPCHNELLGPEGIIQKHGSETVVAALRKVMALASCEHCKSVGA